MRLIDADVALQRFVKETETSGKNVIHINTIKRLLQDIDTAYDVEKVVAEIKELSFEWLGDIRTCDVIKILRKGGVE